MANATQRAIRRANKERQVAKELAERDALIARLHANNVRLAGIVLDALAVENVRRADTQASRATVNGNGNITPVERRTQYASSAMQGNYPVADDDMASVFKNAAIAG